MSNQTCIPIPVGSPNPIIWHMDIGDKLKIQNLKYGANQHVYATCGPQVADVCGPASVRLNKVDADKATVDMKGTLQLGARIAIPHIEGQRQNGQAKNTMYKKIHLVCK